MLKVTPEDLYSLIEIFDNSEWGELRVSLEGFELHLSKDPAATAIQHTAHVERDERSTVTHTAAADTVKVEPTKLAVSTEGEIEDGLVAVRAPNLGTFYQSPKPGANPYVEIGQRVDRDTELCVIEVMKLYTPVVAGMTGIVRQRLVKDGEMVEFDQSLFLIEPTP